MRKLALIAAGLALFSAGALADKTLTYLKAGSEVTSLHFDISSGKVVANVCGRAPLSGGGFGPVSCYPTVLTSGAIFTNVNNLATGGALTFWQGQEAL